MIKWIFLFCIGFPFISFSQMSIVQLKEISVSEPVTRDIVVDKWNEEQPNFNKLSKDSKEFLYWVNYARRNPGAFWDSAVSPLLKTFPSLNVAEAKSLKKDLIKTGPLQMFRLNESLIKTAQYLAFDISSKKLSPSHTSSNGTDFGTRMMNAGIKNCANENISITSQGSLMAVALLYLDINLPGLGHRKSLLDPKLVETGIGSAAYGKGQVFIVQDLACSQK